MHYIIKLYKSIHSYIKKDMFIIIKYMYEFAYIVRISFFIVVFKINNTKCS